MSRSNPTSDKNPSTRWFRWDSQNATFCYWDSEKKEQVNVDNFTFMLLDVLSKIGGFHVSNESRIYSNEVKDLNEPLAVKCNGKTLLAGKYQDIKAEVEHLGGRYVSSAYIAYPDENKELQIGNIEFKGASLGAFIDFKKKHKEIYEMGIKCSGYEEGKKGAVKFTYPTFELVKISEEAQNTAVELDKQLQAYLQSSKPIEAVTEDSTPTEQESFPTYTKEEFDEADSQLPF